MNLSLPIHPTMGRMTPVVVFLFFQMIAFPSWSQTVTTIDYTNSGLPNTTSTGADVFANTPVINGLSHSTLSSLPWEYIFNGGNGVPDDEIFTAPPGFDGVSARLGASYTRVETDYSDGSRTYRYFFVTDVCNIGYTFVPGYNYQIIMNYGGSKAYDFTGVGMSLGTPQLTNQLANTGEAMTADFGTSSSGVTVDDKFLGNTFYSDFLPIYDITAFTDLQVPPFSVGSPVTGLNIEALPTPNSGTTYLKIRSLSIIGLPPVTPTVFDLCTSGTYSINSSWPLTWSIAPDGIASITPSGNSVTVSKIANGIATLTANLTGPDGKVYTVNRPVRFGFAGQPADFSIQADVPCVTGRIVVPSTFNAVPAQTAVTYHWSSGGLLIPGTGSTMSKKFNPGTYEVTAYAENVCGSSDETTVSFNVVSCSGSQSTGSSALSDSASSLFAQGTATGIVKVSPNPAVGTMAVTLQAPEGLLTPAGQEIKEIRIIDKTGRLIRRQLFPAGTKATTINLTGINPDIYLLQVNDGKTISTQKIMVSR